MELSLSSVGRGSDHGELRTEEGCRALLVVEPEDYMPGFAS